MRISGGEYRGRRLRVPKGIRPTESRVREALFSIWHSRVQDKRFLDLFAGSGAVGLEALSRSASEVVLVEKSVRVRRVLEENCKALTDGGWTVIGADLPRELAALAQSGSYDLIFADPPYGFSSYLQLIAGTARLLNSGGLFAVEHSVKEPLPETAGDLVSAESRRYGDSRLTFYCPSAVSKLGQNDRKD